MPHRQGYATEISSAQCIQCACPAALRICLCGTAMSEEKFPEGNAWDDRRRGTLRVRLWLLTGAPARSSATDWLGRLIACDLKATAVSLLPFGTARPTLCLARLKSMPTPAFFLRFWPPFAIASAGPRAPQPVGRLWLCLLDLLRTRALPTGPCASYNKILGPFQRFGLAFLSHGMQSLHAAQALHMPVRRPTTSCHRAPCPERTYL